MKPTLLALLLALALAFAALAPRAGAPARADHAVAGQADAASAKAAPRHETVASKEVARIRAHLARVERELRSRDVSHLSAQQRAARAAALGSMREYRRSGIFPHNHDFPGRFQPYFVDRHGTLCAMAYLIARSGRPELVARIAATRNNAYVRELAHDPELAAWLERNGISVEEATRIQPAYPWDPHIGGSDPGVSPGYAVASIVSAGVNGAAMAFNLGAGGQADGGWWRGVFGLGAGAAGIALGAAGWKIHGEPTVLGAVNAGIGALAAGLGLRTLLDGIPAATASDAARPDQPARLSLSTAPLLSRDGGTGMLLRLNF